MIDGRKAELFKRNIYTVSFLISSDSFGTFTKSYREAMFLRTLYKHLFPILLLFVLFISSCRKEQEENEQAVFKYENIEEMEIALENRYTDALTGLDYTGWGVYEDIIFPGTGIEWSINHETFEGRNLLVCEITGGDAYNNAFFTNTVAIAWEGLNWPYTNIRRFIYSLDFYIDGTFDCENPDNSTLEGIEFTWQHVVVPVSFGFGIQYSKAGEWRYWNDEKDPATGAPKAWQSFDPEINTCLPTQVWNHIDLEGELVGEGIQYLKMNLNGTEFNLSSGLVGKALIPESWVENFLQVGVQLNGNKATDESHVQGLDPVRVYLDNFSLQGF